LSFVLESAGANPSALPVAPAASRPPFFLLLRADEPRLDRKVVVTVLAPALAAGVSARVLPTTSHSVASARDVRITPKV
jgi:hypothetical protein